MSNSAARFYKDAEVTEGDGGFGVALDGRALRTPGGAMFRVPTHAMATACASEWASQGEKILAHTMPQTRLSNVAIDRTPAARGDLAGHIGSYIETDLLMHRAEAPASLVARQARAWDPLLAWARGTLNIVLPVVIGVTPAPIAEETRRRIEDIAAGMDDFRLTGLAHAAGLAGSSVIAFAMLHGRLDGLHAFEAACLDDLFSLETWGEDEPARLRLEGIYAEFFSLQRFFALLSPLT